jgi:hypothetical protein
MEDIYSLQRSKLDHTEFSQEVANLNAKLDALTQEFRHLSTVSGNIDGLYQTLHDKASVHDLRSLSVELSKKLEK